MTTPAVILIAEDSVVVRAVLRKHLAAQGHEMLEAADGHAALRLCREHRPDVVLLDVEMPGLDGHEVLRALQADDELAAIPVVFLTGRTGTDDLVAGLELGAHDYLKKPFDPAELIARVNSALRLKRLDDELRRRNAELDLIGRTDALTGLYNRRHIGEQLRNHMEAARRHGFALSVLILDVDHFKTINDTVGHAAGDAVLAELAARIRAVLRDQDVAARWGGEEFLVVLPWTDNDGGVAFAERLRVAVETTPFLGGNGAPALVTISGGVATWMEEGSDEFVRRADAALYAAKESGRNRVVAAPALSDPPGLLSGWPSS